MPDIFTIFLYFMIYSCLGWCCETVYCSIGQKRFVNRGFLNGPLCPVYGCGALLVIFLLKDVQSSVIPLFLSGMVVTTVLEYLTSVLLEKLFHMKWWDYSHFRFNINGRVCLLNSCEFGALSVFVMMVLHPMIERFVGRFSSPIRITAAVVLLVIIVADTVVTVLSLLKLKGKLDEMYERLDEIREKTEEGAERFKQELSERTDDFRETLSERVDELKETFAVRAEILQADMEEYRQALSQRTSLGSEERQRAVEEAKEKLSALGERMKQLEKEHITSKRILEAFPNLRKSQYNRFREQLEEKIESYRKNKK